MIGYNQNSCESCATNYYQSDKDRSCNSAAISQAYKISCKRDRR